MTIIIVPTEKCNFRCTGCFEPDAVHEGVGIKYSYKGIKQSLQQVWSGPYKGSDVCLHGGEPLMTPLAELEKIMKLIYNLPWDDTGKVKGAVSIVTNGSLITDKHIALFKKYNVNVALSCDGPPDMNLHRGPDPSDPEITAQYNRDMKALILRLRRAGVNVTVMCILHRDNASSTAHLKNLGKWLLWLKKQGVTGGRLNPMYSNRHPELELTNRQIYWVWRNLYNWNKTYGLRWNPVIEMENNVKRETGKHGHFFPKPCVNNRCNPFNTHTLSILPDGTIGCCDRTFDHGLFVRSTDQKKCGRYEALEQLDCEGCRFWDICGGGCPEEGEGGDWRKKTRFCQAIYDTCEYIAEKNGVDFVSTKRTTEQVGNSPHGDTAHGDSEHGDSIHGDSDHGDSAHGDMTHGDSTHGDDPDYV